MARKKYQPSMLNGQKWRASHQATIDAILGPDVRSVVSRGSQFFNKDNWTGRAFLAAVSEWARLNPGRTPERHDVEGWVYRANQRTVYQGDERITIASTPDELPRFLAHALVGGGYHEAWHTKWSRIKSLHIDDVLNPVLNLWALIPFDADPEKGEPGWARLMGSLLTWSNIIEDVRIERLGCREYPGVQKKMEALQDLILQQESEGRTQFEAQGQTQTEGQEFLSVVMGVFRDLGLGYQTTRQKTRLIEYRDRAPDAFDFVVKGSLRPLLDRTIVMGAHDDMGCIWLAMEVLGEIFRASKLPPPPKDEKPPKGEGKGDQPAPPQDQNADYDEDPEEADDDAPSAPPPRAITFKVGQKATLKSGPYKGRVVEIVRAGLPDAITGEQALEFALIEED
jgi:hypothetical protein